MLSLRDLTSGEFQFVTDELPERPENVRTLSESERKAYRAHLMRMVSSSNVCNGSRFAALGRLIELDTVLYTSTIANTQAHAVIRVELGNGQEVVCHV